MSTVRECTLNNCITFSASSTSPMSNSKPTMSSRPRLSALVSGTVGEELVNSSAVDSSKPRRSKHLDLSRHCYNSSTMQQSQSPHHQPLLPPSAPVPPVKVKASHTRYQALGPEELIPVYRQSACRSSIR